MGFVAYEEQIGRQVEEPLEFFPAGLQFRVHRLAVAGRGKQGLERRHQPVQEMGHGLGQVRGDQQGAQRYVAVTQRNRGLVLTRGDRFRLEHREPEPEHLRHPLACGVQRGPKIARSQHQSGQVGRQIGFAPALLGFGGAQAGLARRARWPAARLAGR